MIKELLKLSLNIVIFISLYSCTVNPPIINEIDWDVTFFKDEERSLEYEILNVFLNIYDEDGEGDIETVFLISDESQFYWELNSNNWDIKVENETRWIGATSLVMPNRSPIPRGPIRVFVRDLAGESVDDKIYISKSRVEPRDIIYPELELNDNKIVLLNYDSGVVDIYLDDLLLTSGKILKGESIFKEVFKRDLTELNPNISLYVTVKKGDLKIKSGPWNF